MRPIPFPLPDCQNRAHVSIQCVVGAPRLGRWSWRPTRFRSPRKPVEDARAKIEAD